MLLCCYQWTCDRVRRAVTEVGTGYLESPGKFLFDFTTLAPSKQWLLKCLLFSHYNVYNRFFKSFPHQSSTLRPGHGL